MTVATTSKAAYEKIKSKLGKNQLIVYEAIKTLGRPTNEEIADFLGWPINCVTGRVTELRGFNMVGSEGLGTNKSGFTAKRWGVRDLNDSTLLEIGQDCGE